MIIDLIPNEGQTYKAYLVIPGAGCDGCISNAEKLMQVNIDRYDIRFIFTKIESQKILALKIGRNNLLSKNVFLDQENKILSLFEGRDINYPFVLYLNGNKITGFSEFTPQYSENFDRFVEFLHELPVCSVNIEDLIKSKGKPDSILDTKIFKVVKIKLQKPEGPPIGVVTDFKYSSTHTFLLDRSLNIFIHDMDGNLIYSFNRRGNGPEEYNNVGFFDVDTLDKRIFMFDYSTSKIQVYNYNGTFRKTIKMPFQALNFSYRGKDNILISVPDYHQVNDEKFELYEINENGEIRDGFKHYENIERKTKADLFNAPLMKKTNNGIQYWITNSDIVYRINNDNSIAKYCVFNQGNLKIPQEVSENLELYNQNLGKYVYQLNAIETHNNLFIRFFYNMKHYGATYNKREASFQLTSMGRKQPYAIYPGIGEFWPIFSFDGKGFSFIYENDDCYLIAISDQHL
jgi:hypothetical protein